MFRAIARLSALIAGVLTIQQASAFSFQGAFAAYHDLSIGYRWGSQVNTIGGPMNLGEEYRWNQPNVYYTFDDSFLNYFGQRGVEQVESAMAVLNQIPNADEIDINSFPLHSQRINYRAQALRLVDLKSVVLQSVLEEMGLADPTRYVFTIRSRWTPPNSTNYIIIKRNFDPDSLQPTSYVNGQLWTYLTIFDNQDAPIAYPVNRPVDPLIFAEPVATGFGWTFGRFTFGSFYTGLTRDDAAGLRYIYHPKNANVEDLSPVVTSSIFPGSGPNGAAGGGGTVLPPLLSGDGSASPWGPGLFNLLGAFNTPNIGGQTQPWDALIFSTNSLTNGLGGGVLNTNNTAQNTNGTAALRPGINKVTFKRVNFDSLLGQLIDPVLDTYSDTIILNGARRTGRASRVVFTPDIVFTAADLTGLAPGGGSSAQGYFMVLRSTGFVNNNLLNGTERLDGPGLVRGPVTITFNNLGPFFLNAQPSFLSEGSFGYSFIWGSFDNSTNAPVLYPVNSSLRDLENLVTGGR